VAAARKRAAARKTTTPWTHAREAGGGRRTGALASGSQVDALSRLSPSPPCAVMSFLFAGSRRRWALRARRKEPLQLCGLNCGA